jgi:nicotinate-nucleotide adenylyltransferase
VTDTSAPEESPPDEPRARGKSAPAAAAQAASTGPQAQTPTTAIGILGGTFNPPHRGHLALARHAKAELGLDRVLLMPAHSAPHKGDEEDPGPQRRLEMCRLAVGGAPGLEACGLEIERGGPSYTVDTLRAIHASKPEAELTFIVGADMARTLPAWREPQALVELADLAVAEREDAGREDVLRALAPLSAGVAFLKMPLLEISSSMVRRRVQESESIDELVEPAVAEYIAERGLYRARAAAGTRADGEGQAPEVKADTEAQAPGPEAQATAKAGAK